MTARRKAFADVTIGVEFLLDQRHLDMMMSDEWQSRYYRFDNETEALEYVARCLVVFHRLDNLDGHANLPVEWAPTRIVSQSDHDVDIQIDEAVDV